MNTEFKSPFGFDFLNMKEKTQKVFEVFNSVSGSYDLMNDLMSGGTHRLWKKYFIDSLPLRPGIKILDLATGTGDIAIRMASKAKEMNIPLHITGVDPNENMLEKAKTKAHDAGIISGLEWTMAPGEELPFDDGSFDLCTISFGLRNASDIDQVLREINRVLTPGGQFSCLEFSHPTSAVVEIPYEFYSFAIIPLMGQIVTGDKASYEYLVQSIRTFPKQEELIQKQQEAGFIHNSYENLLNGIVAIHKGFSSQSPESKVAKKRGRSKATT
jgi:demethylmenaquinone methyltransferase/2-methoxy-6-polyprenyl-1,4-benzoquinol methylase